MRSSLCGLLLFCLVLAGCGGSDLRHELRDRPGLDDFLSGYVERDAYPFLYARLEDRDGNLIYEHSAANPALLDGARIDGQTWFRIWSMSKLVTISVVMDLVEDGVLRLDDPVARYIPEFAGLQVATGPAGENLARVAATLYGPSGSAESAVAETCPLPTVDARPGMTVADLIHHRAGFYYGLTRVKCLDELFLKEELTQAKSSEDLILRLSRLPLIQQPGEDYFYGTGTTVLGLVAERATGKPLAALVEERLTRPADIEGLQYGLPEGVALLPRVTGDGGTLRVFSGEELDLLEAGVSMYSREYPLNLGGEGMVATADGYADFLRLFLAGGELNGHRFLQEATIRDMTSPHTLTDNPAGYNGYNLWVNNGRLPDGRQGQGGLWIGGGYEGTQFWIDPDRGFVGVVMTQVEAPPPAANGFIEAFREAVYDRLLVDGQPVRSEFAAD